MKCHTDTAACHSQFGNTCLEECSAEVILSHSLGHLQETISLIRVRQVGRSTNHVRYLFCQSRKTSSRCVTCSIVGLLLNLCPVDLWSLVSKPVSLSSSLFRICISPFSFFCITSSTDLLQFFSTLSIKFLHVIEDLEWIFRVTTQILNCVSESVTTKRSTMSLAVTFIRRTVGLQSALTHDTLTDNQCRFANYSFSSFDSLTDFSSIVTIDFNHFPTEGTILGSCIFVHYFSSFSRKLDVV